MCSLTPNEPFSLTSWLSLIAFLLQTMLLSLLSTQLLPISRLVLPSTSPFWAKLRLDIKMYLSCTVQVKALAAAVLLGGPGIPFTSSLMFRASWIEEQGRQTSDLPLTAPLK